MYAAALDTCILTAQNSSSERMDGCLAFILFVSRFFSPSSLNYFSVPIGSPAHTIAAVPFALLSRWQVETFVAEWCAQQDAGSTRAERAKRSLAHAELARWIFLCICETDVSTEVGRVCLAKEMDKFAGYLDVMEVDWLDAAADARFLNLMIRGHTQIRNFDYATELLNHRLISPKKPAGRDFHRLIAGLLTSVLEEEETDASRRTEQLEAAIRLHDDYMQRKCALTELDAETNRLFFELAATGSSVAEKHSFAILRNLSKMWSVVSPDSLEALLKWLKSSKAGSEPEKPRFIVTKHPPITKYGRCFSCQEMLINAELPPKRHADLLQKVYLRLPSEAAKQAAIRKFDEWLEANADADVVIDGHNILMNPKYVSRSKPAFTWEQRQARGARRNYKKMSQSRVTIGNIHSSANLQDVTDLALKVGTPVSVVLPPPAEHHSGSGTINFYRKEEALNAVAEVNGTWLGGKHLHVKMKDTVNETSLDEGKTVTILNVPQMATWTEIRSHFTSILGEKSKRNRDSIVRAVELDKKKSEFTHDGRATVQFKSNEEAKRAIKMLNGRTYFGSKLFVRIDNRWKDYEGAPTNWIPDRLQTALDFYHSRGLKAISLCRKHVLTKSDPNGILQHYVNEGLLYPLPNALEDDVFFIYAALKLGIKTPGIKLVTNDHLRDHVQLTRLFNADITEDLERWCYGHICTVHLNIGNLWSYPPLDPVFTEQKSPPLFNAVVQEEKGSWHIPYGDPHENSRTENAMSPTQWICAKVNNK